MGMLLHGNALLALAAAALWGGGDFSGGMGVKHAGGTMGVAIIGSVFASLFGPAIHRAFEPFRSHGLSLHQLNVAQSSVEAAKMTASHLSASAQSVLAPKLTAAFMDGFHRGCLVAATTAAVVALIVFSYLPAHQSVPNEEYAFEH